MGENTKLFAKKMEKFTLDKHILGVVTNGL